MLKLRIDLFFEAMERVYTAWFRDDGIPDHEEVCEWCACIIIVAVSDSKAQQWGDYLAKARAKKKGGLFLWSKVESKYNTIYRNISDWDTVPLIKYGDEASDETIGW